MTEGIFNGVPKEMSKTKEAYAWHAIKGRCYNPKNRAYKYYGARGIKVCPEWRNSFRSFYNDMGKAPSKDHSIDRINVNGDYAPENCRWATIKEQNRNKRTTVFVTLNGEQLSLAEACERFGIRYEYAIEWVKKGENDFFLILEKRKELEEYRFINTCGNPNLFRPVNQLSLSCGSLIKKWESIKDASLHFSGILSSHISNVARLNSKYINAHGFAWAYDGEIDSKKEEILSRRKNMLTTDS